MLSRRELFAGGGAMHMAAGKERMQDWHIAHFRPLTIERSGDGHWQMDFIMSVLVLKHELPENYISNGYDR